MILPPTPPFFAARLTHLTALLFFLLLPTSAQAYGLFYDKDEQGTLTVAHWPKSKLPLFLFVDKEEITIEGFTPIQLAKEASLLWKQVPGTHFQVQIDTLDKDINETNFDKEVVIPDGTHEIIFEQKGALLRSLGLDPDFVSGIGLPITTSNPKGNPAGPFSGEIIDSLVIINTQLLVGAAMTKRLLAHEMGHAFGLGHTNIAHVQNIEKLPVMFYNPMSQQGEALLHKDDMAGLATLYPSESYEQLFGAIKGKVVRLDGSPAFGVVVSADSPKTGPIGTWSDAQGNFEISGLPEGEYTVFVRALDGSKDVNQMLPSFSVGGIFQNAITKFCPEWFDDLSFTNCLFARSTNPKPVSIKVSRTVRGFVIKEGPGNPSARPDCVWGSAPRLPHQTEPLPPIFNATRGDPCPKDPITNEPVTPKEEPVVTAEPDQPMAPEKPDSGPSDWDKGETMVMPVCGCHTSPSLFSVAWLLWLLAVPLLLRKKN